MLKITYNLRKRSVSTNYPFTLIPAKIGNWLTPSFVRADGQRRTGEEAESTSLFLKFYFSDFAGCGFYLVKWCLPTPPHPASRPTCVSWDALTQVQQGGEQECWLQLYKKFYLRKLPISKETKKEKKGKAPNGTPHACSWTHLFQPLIVNKAKPPPPICTKRAALMSAHVQTLGARAESVPTGGYSSQSSLPVRLAGTMARGSVPSPGVCLREDSHLQQEPINWEKGFYFV